MPESVLDELFGRHGPVAPSAKFEEELFGRLDDELARLESAGATSDLLIEPRLDEDDEGIAVMRIEEARPVPKTSRDLVLLAAAAIVVIGGLWFAFSSGDEDSAPIITDDVEVVDESESIAIAEAFMAARDSWDGEALVELLAPDATIDGFVDSPQEYRDQSAFEQKTGWRFLDPACSGPPTEVTCSYTMENDWSNALGVGPYSGSTFDFVIDNGQISHLQHSFDTSSFSNQVWEPVRYWVFVNHPDEYDAVYESTGPTSEIPRKSPEAVALWESFTTEFVAIQLGLDFMEARDAWDAAVVQSLLTDDAVIVGELFSSADEYASVAEFHRAIRSRVLEPQCQATAIGPPSNVSCSYTMENAWSKAMGVGPYSGSRFDFVIDDGEIQQVDHFFDQTPFSSEVWEVFREWIRDNHLEDLNTMYDFSDRQNDIPRTTPEALTFWERYTAEFVESVG